MGQVRDQPQRVLKRAASDVVYEHPDGRAQAARLSALRKVQKAAPRATAVLLPAEHGCKKRKAPM